MPSQLKIKIAKRLVDQEIGSRNCIHHVLVQRTTDRNWVIEMFANPKHCIPKCRLDLEDTVGAIYADIERLLIS